MSLHLRDEGEGEGEAVVLLHGLGASSRVFDAQFVARRGRRLLAVDLPRTGRSGHWAASTPAALAEALVRALDARRVPRFGLFGHSFGGLVALELAARFPERVAHLTVASAPALGVPAELRLLLANPLTELTLGWLGRLPVWRPALQGYLQLIWGSTTAVGAQHVDLYAEAVQAPGFSEGMVEALRAVAAFRVPGEALARSPFPRAVLWGELDRLVPVVQGEQLARAIGARFEVLAGVGHCLPEEHPEAVRAAISGSAAQ